MIKTRIKAAQFGAGRIGHVHAPNLASIPGVELTYISDVYAPAAEALAAQYGARTATAREIFDDPSVEAVVIASITSTHADLIEHAASAGKAIFCEKPVDLDLERARQAQKAVDNAGVLCMVGFQRRFDPTFNSLKTRLEAGEIGTPEVLLITSRDQAPPHLSYFRTSGYIFRDMLIHDFDIFRWILDEEAATIHATGSCLVDPAIAAEGDIDTAIVNIRGKSGKLCQINASRRATFGYDQRFEVLGSTGMMQAGNHRPTEVTSSTAKQVATDSVEPYFLQRYRIAYHDELVHFFDAIRTGGPVRTTMADAIKAQELAEAATQSWQTGQIVTL